MVTKMEEGRKKKTSTYYAASRWDDLLPPSSFLLPDGDGQEG